MKPAESSIAEDHAVRNGSAMSREEADDAHNEASPSPNAAPSDSQEEQEVAAPLSVEDSDDDDEYVESDETDLEDLANTERLGYGTSLLDHSAYFADSISQALDSLALDKSLVVQAQLSGQLNNENQRIKDKRAQVMEKTEIFRDLYQKHFGSYIDPVTHTKTTRAKQLQKDLLDIEKRLASLNEGTQQQKALGTFFTGAKKQTGVIQRFPVEYNQARDKILERQIEE